jgi:hypothetical protein
MVPLVIRQSHFQRRMMRHISFYDIEQCKKDGMEEAEWARRPSSASMIKPPPYQAIDPQLVWYIMPHILYIWH